MFEYQQAGAVAPRVVGRTGLDGTAPHREVAPSMKTMFQYQLEGSAAVVAGTTALAFDAGLGKTATMLHAAGVMGARTILVVCPAIATGVWTGQVAEWRPDLRAVTVREAMKNGKVPARDRVLISSYDMLVVNRGLREKIGGLSHDLLIIDEGQALKNPRAKRTMLVYGPGCAGGPRSLVGRCGATKVLSATLVMNHAGELFPHLRCLSPERIDQRSYQAFVDHYCVKGVRTVRTKTGRSVNIETIEGSNRERLPDLAKRLRGWWLRKKVEDVLQDLPPLRVEVQRLPAEALDAAALAEVEGSPEAEQLRRAVATGDPEALRHLEGHMARLRRLLALAKVDACTAWVEGALDAGEPKIGVFGHHVEPLKRIHAALTGYDPVLITGETGRRDALVDKFQNDPKCRVAVLQLQAAGTAITLTAGRRVIFLEQSFVPAQNHQAVKRFHRIGSTNAVLAEVLAAPGLDEAVAGILTRKLSDIQAIEEDAA